jgi:ATP adenylyltransferase
MRNRSCGICQEIQGRLPSEVCEGYFDLIRSNRNILFETRRLLVLPSVGPLNPSHVMVVPKKHVNSLAEAGSDYAQELSLAMEAIREHGAKRLQKRVVFFESGTGKLVSHSGGCIVHAHLHAVTESEGFQAETPMTRVGRGDFFGKADLDGGYVLYVSAQGEYFLSNAPKLPSQFLRYLYSQCENTERLWNWRRHHNIEGVRKVVATFEGLQRSLS